MIPISTNRRNTRWVIAECASAERTVAGSQGHAMYRVNLCSIACHDDDDIQAMWEANRIPPRLLRTPKQGFRKWPVKQPGSRIHAVQDRESPPRIPYKSKSLLGGPEISYQEQRTKAGTDTNVDLVSSYLHNESRRQL